VFPAQRRQTCEVAQLAIISSRRGEIARRADQLDGLFVAHVTLFPDQIVRWAKCAVHVAVGCDFKHQQPGFCHGLYLHSANFGRRSRCSGRRAL